MSIILAAVTSTVMLQPLMVMTTAFPPAPQPEEIPAAEQLMDSEMTMLISHYQIKRVSPHLYIAIEQPAAAPVVPAIVPKQKFSDKHPVIAGAFKKTGHVVKLILLYVAIRYTRISFGP